MSAINVSKSAEFSGHSGAIYALCNGHLPATVLSGSVDKFVAAWDYNEGVASPFSVKLDAAIYALSYFPQEQCLFIGQAHGGIHLVDVQRRKELRLLQWHKKGVFDIGYSEMHNLFWSCGGDGTLAIAQLQDMELQRHFPLAEAKIRQVALAGHGKLMAVACGDGKVHLLDTQNFNTVEALDAHHPGANSVCFSPNDALLFTGGRDAHLRVWDLHNFKQVLEIPAHNYTIYSIVFAPNSTHFATASRDKTIKIWDANTMEVVQRLDHKSGGHRNSVNKLLWNENGLFSAGDDGKIMVWQVN